MNMRLRVFLLSKSRYAISCLLDDINQVFSLQLQLAQHYTGHDSCVQALFAVQRTILSVSNRLLCHDGAVWLCGARFCCESQTGQTAELEWRSDAFRQGTPVSVDGNSSIIVCCFTSGKKCGCKYAMVVSAAA